MIREYKTKDRDQDQNYSYQDIAVRVIFLSGSVLNLKRTNEHAGKPSQKNIQLYLVQISLDE